MAAGGDTRGAGTDSHNDRGSQVQDGIVNTIRALVWKEFRQLRNDPISIRLMILPVLFQVLVLGYAVTTEVRNTPVTICDRSETPQSRSLVRAVAGHDLFVFTGMSRTEREVRRKLDAGEVRIGMVIPPDFARAVGEGRAADVELVVDGQDANSSNVAGGYISAIINGWAFKHYTRKLAAMGKSIDDVLPARVRPVILFNPLLKSTWYMVPAMAVLLVTMVTALLTGFSIVRERESGTLEQLLVTPLRSVDLVVGKSIPFMIIGFVELVAILLFAQVWFWIPFRGNYATIFVFAFIYMFSSIGIGVLTSTISRTAHQALFATWFILIFFVLLSGFFLPIENMPRWVQEVTRINPVRYFMTVVREVFLKGTGMRELWREAGAMVGIGVAVYGCALFSFKRRVG
ncbi:MAG: ABC transporter permease subunit [Chitinivibrionales bacterium]|nr:ABC transporter permease subunit [Chitinivibrionales bacterium]MBD3396562.1 ABC transporter permease subunit [Chitinivibrionales bacterium]